MSIQAVPAELLIKIANKLERHDDLHNLRLVSRAFAEAGWTVQDDDLRARGISTVKKYWRAANSLGSLQKLHTFAQDLGTHRITFLNLQIRTECAPENGDALLPALRFPALKTFWLQRLRFSSNKPVMAFLAAHQSTLDTVFIEGCQIVPEQPPKLEEHLWSPVLVKLDQYPLKSHRWCHLHSCDSPTMHGACRCQEHAWDQYELVNKVYRMRSQGQRPREFDSQAPLIQDFHHKEMTALLGWAHIKDCEYCQLHGN